MNSEITKYLQELKRYLRRLDDSEIKDIEDFYTEYLEDAGVQTRAEIEEKVGTPRQLSLRILADYSLKDDGKESGGILPKTNIKTAWLIILALLATPATLIIGVALLGVLVAAIGVAFAVAVTIIALAGAAIFITLTSLLCGNIPIVYKIRSGTILSWNRNYWYRSINGYSTNNLLDNSNSCKNGSELHSIYLQTFQQKGG